jgi:hypothetical protein
VARGVEPAGAPCYPPAVRTPALSAILSLLALASGACAIPRFEVRVRHLGAVDLDRDAAAAARAADLPWERAYAVEVHQGALPEGLALRGSTLEVSPAQAGRYAVVASLSSAHATSAMASYAASTWWYVTLHDRHSRGRDAFCKAQLPLRVLTLGIWSLFSPTSWPCQVVYPTDEDENLRVHLQELKRAAASLGANLVVVTRVSDETQLAGSLHGTQSYRVGAVEVHAFAVIDRERPAPMP